MSIFDWVTSTFGSGKMEGSPSVMEEGTKVIDPQEEEARRILQQENQKQTFSNVVGSLGDLFGGGRDNERPQMREPAKAGWMDEKLGAGQAGLMIENDEYGPPMPEDTTIPDTLVAGVPAAQGEAGYAGGIRDFGTPPPVQDETIVPPVEGEGEDVPHPDAGWMEEMLTGPGKGDDFVPTHPDAGQLVETLTEPGKGDPEPTANPHPEKTMGEPVVDTDPDITPEEAEEIVKTVDAVPDADVPDGTSKDATKQIAAEDPKGFKKAISWFTKTFGIEGQDLARAALFYAGSRIAGYDHSGSMSFAFEQSMGDIRQREAYTESMIQSGKYTPASTAEFKKTRDISKLKQHVDPSKIKPTKRDLTKPYIDAKGNKYYETTDPDGNKGFTNAGGELYRGKDALKPLEAPKTRSEIVDEYGGGITTTLQKTLENTGALKTEKGVKANPYIKIVPEVAGPQIIEIINDQMGAVDNPDVLNSGLYNRVAQNAMQAAEQHARITKKEIDDIAPFVLAELQYYEQTEEWQQNLRKDGEKLKVEEWDHIKKNVIIQDSPEFEALIEKGYTRDFIINHVMTEQYKQYQADTPAEKRTPDGFWKYMINTK